MQQIKPGYIILTMDLIYLAGLDTVFKRFDIL